MPLPRLWRWWTTLDCKIPSSPDTLWVLLIRFDSMTEYRFCIYSYKLTWPCWGSYNLRKISWTIWSLCCDQLHCTVINCTFTFCTSNVFSYFCSIRFQIRLYHMFMLNWLIGLVGRVFANGLRDLGSIPGCVIPKTLKMVLGTTLLNTQRYKIHIIGKVEQSRERSSALPYTLV